MKKNFYLALACLLFTACSMEIERNHTTLSYMDVTVVQEVYPGFYFEVPKSQASTRAIDVVNEKSIDKIVCFEDSYKGDYDYNDLIFYVRTTKCGGSIKFQIKPMALGATLPAALGVKGVDASGKELYNSVIINDDRKTLFNGDQGFINTNVPDNINDKDYPIQSNPDWYIEAGDGKDDICKIYFYIVVNGRPMFAGAEGTPTDTQGRPYGIVLLSNDFKYPAEYTNIENVYAGSGAWFDGTNANYRFDTPIGNFVDAAFEKVVFEDQSCGGDITGEINVLTKIPDPVFLAYCLSQMSAWDTNHDDILSVAEAAAVIEIDVSATSIIINHTITGTGELASLEGIEYFTGLTSLWCEHNQLTSLDVSQNTALINLGCGNNYKLTSLDVSKNTALTSLYCGNNYKLTSLDVSKNTALTYLLCYENRLTSLDVSKNTALTELHCDHNQLTSLDVSKNTALTYLYCHDNPLTSLDVSQNTALTELNCGHNQLTSLDVSKNTALTFLECQSNPLTSLDVSKNTALTEFSCYDNQLTSLDVSKNTALIGLYCQSNQLTSLDISKNTALIWLDYRYNPGDGISKFPVKAWFEANAVPFGFPTQRWGFNGVIITPEYAKAI
jgi:hypothetical protein